MHPLRRLRYERLLTQLRASRKWKVARRTVECIENRRHCPTVAIRRRILKAEGIPYTRHREIFGPLPAEVYLHWRKRLKKSEPVPIKLEASPERVTGTLTEAQRKLRDGKR